MSLNYPSVIRRDGGNVKRYTKEDVEFHSDGFGRKANPAVNVKVYGSTWDIKLPLELGSYSDDGGKTWKTSYTDPEFTHEWIEEHLSDDSGYFYDACQCAWEALQDEAETIYGKGVTVFSEGRSGGWAVIDGLKDFDEWNAVDLAKWRRFEIIAETYAADIPRTILESAYVNAFEPWKAEREDSRGDETEPMIEARI